MNNTPLNYRIVNAKLTRHELIKLAMACINLAYNKELDEGSREMWKNLYYKVDQIVKEFDSKQEDLEH